MSIKQYKTSLGFAVIIMLVGSLALAWLSTPRQAAADLPGRNTPTPSSPSRVKDEKDNKPIGAYIELYVPSAPVGAWTVVQWRNELGDWYDVQGWQGTLDEQGHRRWWVAKKDFGTGPFRWIVQPHADGPILAASTSFHLPVSAGQTEKIELSLNPQ